MVSLQSKLTLALALALALATACGASASNAGLVQTEYGPVMGVVNVTGGYRYFKGIPFAASTGGANRFRSPLPPTNWTEPRDASAYGPGCFQTLHNPDVPSVLSEDCLNLNVWTPLPPTASGENALLPTMVFFHGGSFIEGSNQGPYTMYDGHHFVTTRPVCVVAANYRLGALGFAVTHELRGNYGLMDQAFALQWVQRSVRAFGCDPTRVTTWGESAGAMSVGLHMVSPPFNGLFTQAIMESNVAGFVYKTMDEAKAYGMSFCKFLGCAQGKLQLTCDTACLQNAPIQEVITAWNKTNEDVWDILLHNFPHYIDSALDFTPTIDGVWLPDNPLPLLAANKINQIQSVLLGSNNDEGATFVYELFTSAFPNKFVEDAFRIIFGKESQQVINYYHTQLTNSSADGRDVFSQMLTDYWFTCSQQKFATAVRAVGGDAYVYFYEHVFSSGQLFTQFGIPPICANRTCHAAELPFVFHISDNPIVRAAGGTFTPEEEVLSQTFVDYWTAFGSTGNPNTGSLPNWPIWNATTGEMIKFKTPALELTNFVELCKFWDTIGYDH